MGAQTEAVPYEEIVSMLAPDDTVALLTCNTCVRVCRTGGVDFMEEMARRLRADGFNVVDEAVVTTACHYDYVANALPREGFTVAIVLACEVGWIAVRQHCPKPKLIRACKTLGLLSSVPKKRPPVPAAAGD